MSGGVRRSRQVSREGGACLLRRLHVDGSPGRLGDGSRYVQPEPEAATSAVVQRAVVGLGQRFEDSPLRRLWNRLALGRASIKQR